MHAENSHRRYRLAVDTGGTFTDLVVEDSAGNLSIFKSPTTPDQPVRGVLDVVELAALKLGISSSELLDRTSLFMYATTHAINAVLTGRTAKTGLLVTAGHRDVLLLREGKRANPFDGTVPYPAPYIPRGLTLGVGERMTAQGEVLRPLDENSAVAALRTFAEAGVEAVAVCLLWSILNPAHELRIGQLIEQHLPGSPYTLSHQVNPIIREYRRASSAAIDASLKPEMTKHLSELTDGLAAHGFSGRIFVVSSIGGVLDVNDIARAPIHCLNSGPSVAPVAARHYASRLGDLDPTVIVADAGGTSYDVSLVRSGRIPRSAETWLGGRFSGHITGFPSIDVKSIGAGGGSLAWVDDGGLLHVGPQSAGAVPGPACYGRGGERSTVTDACLCLGYLNPQSLADDAIRPDLEAARNAVLRHVAEPLGVSTTEAAYAILRVTTELMVGAIQDVTLAQGIDTRSAVLVAGGGAAGLNAAAIGRRLGCSRVIVPQTSSTLSAAGALLSDLSREYTTATALSTSSFDMQAARKVVQALTEQCDTFAESAGAAQETRTISYYAVARYENQVWDLDVPFEPHWFLSDDLSPFTTAFHQLHTEHFAIADEGSPVLITQVRARVDCRLRPAADEIPAHVAAPEPRKRSAYFPQQGEVELSVEQLDRLPVDQAVPGPAIIEGRMTTVVVDPGITAWRTPSGDLVIDLSPDGNSRPGRAEESV